MENDTKYVSQEEFDATVDRMSQRQKAVKAALRLVEKHKNGPLEAKLAAQAILKAARNLPV